MQGILIINKEKEMTSHDVVAIARRQLHLKRIGHAGTLDPMATGLLPLCIGKATRLAEYISSQGKAYEGEMILGFATDTLDITGEKVAEKSLPSLDEETILHTFNAFTGVIDQVPPMVSAVKVNGKRLYAYAREGKEIKRTPRKIQIHELRLLDFDTTHIRFFCRCSKGTYIRQLVQDIAAQWGTLATLSSLTRTEVAQFTLAQARSIEWLKMATAEEIENALLPSETGVMHLPACTVSEKKGRRLSQGAWVCADGKEDFSQLEGKELRLYGPHFLGLGHGEWDEHFMLHLDKRISEDV